MLKLNSSSLKIFWLKTPPFLKKICFQNLRLADQAARPVRLKKRAPVYQLRKIC